MAGKKNVLSSLAVYAEDSEPESDGEAGVETAGSAAEEKGGLVSEAYGEDDFSRLGGDEDGYEEEEDENSKQSEDDDSETEKPEADDPKAGCPAVGLVWEYRIPQFETGVRSEESDTKDNPEVEKRDPQELVASFSERVRNMSPDEIKIPPEPPGRCSNHLQDKIQKLYERKIKEGMDMNYIIQRKKEFRNPSIYEKLIQFCAIDELGTNYPKDMFDPHGWSEDSYYEALAKAQKIEMDKLEKAKKERTKVLCLVALGSLLPKHHVLDPLGNRNLALGLNETCALHDQSPTQNTGPRGTSSAHPRFGVASRMRPDP
ncbi:SAP30-binding protein isoform X2 [Suricata suricatta]|uniref:SAP30-binding protein isoform X2 n=1 Tax=Suricata suricatta TaxID=37032 RepID=UPI001155B04B|nr:SAP30-binding protein isoform X2 [Suricata suricatta]